MARMRALCDRLADLRRRVKRFENWQDVFVGAELTLAGVAVPILGTSVKVRARVDAIRIHPERGLEVVDYKLSQGLKQKAEYGAARDLRTPVADLAAGLRIRRRAGILPARVQRGRDLARRTLRHFRTTVAPVLAETFAPKPKRRARRRRRRANSTRSAQRTVAAFRSFNLSVETAGAIEGPQLVRLRLKPGPGVKVASLAATAPRTGRLRSRSTPRRSSKRAKALSP